MIKKVLIVLLLAVLVGLEYWWPRDESVVFNEEILEASHQLTLGATRQTGTLPGRERWLLRYPRVPPSDLQLSLEIAPASDAAGRTPPGPVAGSVGQAAPPRLTGIMTRVGPATADSFLNELARILGGAAGPIPGPPADRLDFDVTVLGDRLSMDVRGRAAEVVAGQFTSDPEGEWTALKLTVPGGRAEFFLALNPVDSAALLLPKALEDGPALYAAFARLLGPSRRGGDAPTQ